MTTGKALRHERKQSSDAGSSDPSIAPPAASSIAMILRAFGSSIDDDPPRTPTSEPGPDWSILIDKIRTSASRVREVEAQARERESELEKILERCRADLGAADERVRAAEARASQAEATAAERIRALEERARLAEERASICEAWLKQVHDAITSEFSIAGAEQA